MRRRLLRLGIVVLAAAWLGPLPRWATVAFSAHMAMHMAVVALAAPLLSAGLAGGRCDPVRRWPSAFAPVPASFLELVVVWAWHVPLLHHAARGSIAGLVAEQASFLGAGMWLWLAVFGGGTAQRSTRGAAGVTALVLTSVHMTLLGALLTLAPRPLYVHAAVHTPRALTALQDQHLGGAIMLLAGSAVYLAVALFLVRDLLAQSARIRRVPVGATEAEAATGERRE